MSQVQCLWGQWGLEDQVSQGRGLWDGISGLGFDQGRLYVLAYVLLIWYLHIFLRIDLVLKTASWIRTVSKDLKPPIGSLRHL